MDQYAGSQALSRGAGRHGKPSARQRGVSGRALNRVGVLTVAPRLLRGVSTPSEPLLFLPTPRGLADASRLR